MTFPRTLEAGKLLETLPPIRRTRDWRLYGFNGKRYLDMWADNGRAILGYRTAGIGKIAKASVDMGLVSPIPSMWKARLEKRILTWLPDYQAVYFFQSEAEALWTLSRVACEKYSGENFSTERDRKDHFSAIGSLARSIRVEQAFGTYRRERETDPAGTAFGGRFALAILPLHAAWTFGVVLAKENADLELHDPLKTLSSGSLVPGVKLAAAARALADFSEFEKRYNESHWSSIDRFTGGLFGRSGPWLYPLYPAEKHAQVFGVCLERGILISPEYALPSLVPGEFDKGEVAPLASVLLREQP